MIEVESDGKTSEQRIDDAIGEKDTVDFLVLIAQENGVNLADVATLLEKGATADQLYQWMEKDVNLANVTLLLDRGSGDTTQTVNWIQGLDTYQNVIKGK